MDVSRSCTGLLLWLAAVAPAEPAVRVGGAILAGTPAETAWYVNDSGQPGPTVFIVGGIHGNEPAGAAAAEEILHWRLTKGRLVVLPRANVPALLANQRGIPGVPDEEANLNRNFPAAGGTNEAVGPLAQAIWQLVSAQRPDWLLDLHEGVDFSKAGTGSVGSSLIAPRSEPAVGLAKLMQATVNATIADEAKQFMLRLGVVDGSLARAATDHLGVPAMILETTSKGQPRALRHRQHRLLVHRFLSELGLAAGGPDVLVDRDVARALLPAGGPPLLVAIYDGPGNGASSARKVEEALQPAPGAVVRRIGAESIRAGALAQFDVVVFPGGSGSGQGNALEETGRAAVQAFVRDGGGYLGHCAGSYLASHGYAWSLGLIAAEVIDRDHWRRGEGELPVELSEVGRRILGSTAERVVLHYENGPILRPSTRPGLDPPWPLAWFRGEVTEHGAPAGVMPGAPAILAGRFGRGRVVCFSPHPESTPGLESFCAAAAAWAAGRGAAAP